MQDWRHDIDQCIELVKFDFGESGGIVDSLISLLQAPPQDFLEIFEIIAICDACTSDKLERCKYCYDR